VEHVVRYRHSTLSYNKQRWMTAYFLSSAQRSGLEDCTNIARSRNIKFVHVQNLHLCFNNNNNLPFSVPLMAMLLAIESWERRCPEMPAGIQRGNGREENGWISCKLKDCVALH